MTCASQQYKRRLSWYIPHAARLFREMYPDAISTPFRSDWNVAGHPTCTLWWPARSQKAETIILFIPGNPGLIDYYTEFLEKVYQQASPNVEIFGGK